MVGTSKLVLDCSLLKLNLTIMKKQLQILILFVFYACNILAQDEPKETLQWKPVYHFSPLKNWTNDPNGLIYIDGIYHLYNQQNPFENKWGHMSWGHATTTDLVHWKHHPIAMPETIDKDTTWRFSGCAVLDKDNKSGLCKGKNCIVAIYTADQPNLKKESQFIAWSDDGGYTFTNYANNPVIDLHLRDFRDPNVFWYEKTGKWIMVVALPREHKVRFYSSKDLKKWDLLSEFGPQGYIDAAWECPFLIQLPVDNDPGKTKWALFNSPGGGKRGTYMQYFVGDFDGTSFKNDNPADTILTVDYGDSYYGGIPWNNLPPNQKIYIGWMVPGPQETSPWRGQMTIPRDLSLTKTSEGIRLRQQPAAIIKNRLGELSGNKMTSISDMQLMEKEVPLNDQLKLHGNTYWLEAELETDPGTVTGFKIGQKKDQDNKTVSETIIAYDASKNQVFVDRTNIGPAKIKKDKGIQTIDVGRDAGKIKLEILFDNSSLEVFVNNGEKVLTTYTFPETGADLLSAFSLNGKATIKSLKVWDMSGISNSTASN